MEWQSNLEGYLGETENQQCNCDSVTGAWRNKSREGEIPPDTQGSRKCTGQIY